jgi:hypothetical protein
LALEIWLILEAIFVFNSQRSGRSGIPQEAAMD